MYQKILLLILLIIYIIYINSTLIKNYLLKFINYLFNNNSKKYKKTKNTILFEDKKEILSPCDNLESEELKNINNQLTENTMNIIDEIYDDYIDESK